MASNDEIVAMVNDVSEDAGPRYKSLSSAFEQLISDGLLPPGQRLPTQRELATLLGISRPTVVRVYESLRSKSLIEGTIGRGTYVRTASRSAQPRLSELIDFERGASEADTGEIINLTVSKPELLPEFESAVQAIAGRAAGLAAAQAAYYPQGLPELRHLVAAWYSRRGLDTQPQQILITAGAQEALGLIVRLGLRPDGQFVIENPAYQGALDIVRGRTSRIRPIPTGPDGTDIDFLRRALVDAPQSPTLLMPTCHTITGAVTPIANREAIAALAQESAGVIIDDDVFAHLTFDQSSVPPLAAFAPDAPIITLGSTSKLVWGGLRVGWLRASADLVRRLARVKGTTTLGTSLVAQLIAVELLGDLEGVAHRRVAEAMARDCQATELLKSTLPDWSWNPPKGGVSMWLRLPGGASATAFSAIAASYGVSVAPGPMFAANGEGDDHLRLVFMQSEATLDQGIQRLGAAWEHFRSMGEFCPEYLDWQKSTQGAT